MKWGGGEGGGGGQDEAAGGSADGYGAPESYTITANRKPASEEGSPVRSWPRYRQTSGEKVNVISPLQPPVPFISEAGACPRRARGRPCILAFQRYVR